MTHNHLDGPEDHRHLALAFVEGSLREILGSGLRQRRRQKARHPVLPVMGRIVRKERQEHPVTSFLLCLSNSTPLVFSNLLPDQTPMPPEARLG
jgi:hypothetical protein